MTIDFEDFEMLCQRVEQLEDRLADEADDPDSECSPDEEICDVCGEPIDEEDAEFEQLLDDAELGFYIRNVFECLAESQ